MMFRSYSNTSEYFLRDYVAIVESTHVQYLRMGECSE